MCEVSALAYRYSCISYIKGTRTTLNVGFLFNKNKEITHDNERPNNNHV